MTDTETKTRPFDPVENERIFHEVMHGLGARKVDLADLSSVPAQRREAAEVDWSRGTREWRGKHPLYPQLLRLEHVRPNAWQRALLGEGMAAVGGLLAMADLASAWSILVLPLAVAGVVKVHDLLAGRLAAERETVLIALGTVGYWLTDRQFAQLAVAQQA